MDIRKVRKLIELIDETGVAEIEIKEGEESVRISRQYRGPTIPMTTPIMPTAPMPQAKPEEEKLTPTKPAPAAGHTVKSPMVGTVYLAPSPGAAPFVKVGQHVEVGATLCMIEAMKMYNQIESDKAGVISACLVENGHPVEYDQPLFLIE
jgi:acetyl-CoA carboxylase biotin carboxyl carrier protein